MYNNLSFGLVSDFYFPSMYYVRKVGLGCRFKANCLLVGLLPIGGVPSGGSKGSLLVFTQVSEKTTKNSERLGRQARLWFYVRKLL